jgi:hypothetical protein
MMERSQTDDRRLPAPVPAAAKAAISPSALILAGGGAVAGVVVGLPVLVAVVIGAGLWGIRVGAGAALAAGRRHRAQQPEVMDPYAVVEPWRSFVRESLTAQAKFDQAVARTRPGPLCDRLGDVSARVHDGVRECWRVAHLGASLDAALVALNPDSMSGELLRFQQSRSVGAKRSPSPSEVERAKDETEAALAAQLQAARRLEAAVQRATDRLRVLTAELNAAVAGAVELSLDACDGAAAIQLAGNVNSVVGEIEALRRALEETSGTPKPLANPG